MTGHKIQADANIKVDVDFSKQFTFKIIIGLGILSTILFIWAVVVTVLWSDKRSLYKPVDVKDNKTTVVLFYADSCGHCKHVKPVIDNLQAQMPNVNFIKADVYVDPYKSVFSSLGFTGVPKIIKASGIHSIEDFSSKDFNFSEYNGNRQELDIKRWINSS